MRFVPKFHRELMIKLIIFTVGCFAILTPPLICEEVDKNTIDFLIQLAGIYILTVLYFFISWVILNIIEKSFVYEIENENYYRDIIKNISPAELSYIDDYGIETKKDILGTLLMLHLKGNIKIKRDKIEFVSKYKLKEDEYYNLTRTENMVLDCIYKNKSPFKLPNTFEELLMEDLDTAGLIEKEKITPPHFYIKKILQIIYGIILIIYGALTNMLISSALCAVGAIFSIHAIMWLVVLRDYGKSSKEILMGAYRKITPKGNEIRLKLTGLKLFLKDYSNMKNKELKEIELWDEYMIYSVILNDNKKAQRELLKILKKQYK